MFYTIQKRSNSYGVKIMVFKNIIFLLVAFTFCKTLHAQTDTLFWFAAPEVSKDESNEFDRPINFRITTYDLASLVTITQPANPNFLPQIITIPARSTQAIDLTSWIDVIENKPANTVLNYGIKITSTNPVTVYYEADEWLNPEIFVLKGQNALGNEFWIPSQNFLNNSPNFFPIPNSSFDIVATEDNTTITITPTSQIIGHVGGNAFTILLNKGQTYSATAASGLAANHLNGSKVISNKPIAITIKDDLLNGLPDYGTCSDLCGDQIVPVNLLGTEYIAINGFLNSPKDMVFVLATQNGTNIYQDGNLVSTINAGQTIRLSVGDSSTHIKSTSPVYVLQLSGFGCEFGIDVLPPIICTGSTEVAFTRSVSEPLFLNILVRGGGQNSFFINGVGGVVNGTNFKQVPGTSGQWFTGQFTLPSNNYPVESAIRITNSINSTFHASIIHGGATTGSRFGYFSNFNKIKVKAYINNNQLCDGATIKLSADSIFQAIYSWKGPNGFYSNTRNSDIFNIQALNSGKYIVTASVLGCQSLPDTVSVTINPTTNQIINASICQGNVYTFPNGDTSTISVRNTSVLISSLGCDSIINTNLIVAQKSYSNLDIRICEGQFYLGYSKTGIYIDTLVSANGCDSIRTLNLTVLPKAFSTISQTICQGQSYLGYSSSGIYIDTLTSSNGCDSIRTLNLTVEIKSFSNYSTTICKGENYHGYTVSGTFIDTLVASNGCDSIRTIRLEVLDNCEVLFPSAFTPNNDGKNDVFKALNANNLTDFSLAIFNRWGEKVFETLDFRAGWNGVFNGVQQPAGAYVWYSRFIKAGVRKQLKGTVILIR
ncbi:MAG: gliding motility-associated C-terminal domain-containing protein [Chitinophagaceae bacterium]|nr:gliding motility-associated C-terminal domain-containing protein [Chitinophagaceae bacterium]